MVNIKDSLVIVIDFQEKLVNSVYNKDHITKKAEIITKAASILDIPIIYTEQYPKGLGKTIENVKTDKKNKYFEKTSFSATEVPEFLAEIKTYNKKQIILFGIETHICVSQTAQSLALMGYEVFIISDASSSRKECEHFAGINRMHDCKVNALTAEICLFEWLKTAQHNNFKEIQKLIL